MDLKPLIRNIPNFPKKGIIFRDITTLLKDGKAFEWAIRQIAHHFSYRNIDSVACIEARGFILGGAIASKLHTGVLLLRKSGKLPFKKKRIYYELEYGRDSLEMHVDAIRKGQRILLVDDLLATGGTVSSAVKLIEKLGGVVKGVAFLVELDFLSGREKLKDYEVFSLVHYENE